MAVLGFIVGLALHSCQRGTFFEAYHDQLTRMAQQEAHDYVQPPEDIDDGDFDDEIPM